MAVHLVYSTAGAQLCDRYGADNELRIFLGDGVYAYPGAINSKRRILAVDAEQRGVKFSVEDGLDYNALVNLLATNNPVVSWHQ